VDLAAAIPQGQPPPSVAWLLDHDAAAEAAREWRRIHSARGSSRGEALAAAELARELGRNNETIRWLRPAFPELGRLEMWRVPVNVVHAYLPLPWRESFRSAAQEAGIEPWLLAAVGRQESTFNPRARSPRGAMGVLQLMPATAGGIASALGVDGRPDLYDPEVNLRLGAHELARLIRKYGEIEVALAAYNAGETRARRWWRTWPDRFNFTEAIPIPETYNYVRRVTFLAEGYRTVYADVWRRPQ
jgi:soluble lytic murein transglycosylase